MLARAREAGVIAILAIGSGTASDRLDAAIPFAEQVRLDLRDRWHSSARSESCATDEWYEELARLAKHPRVMAWGEIGLDYHYDHSPREVQQSVFRRQLTLARAAKLPGDHPLPRCVAGLPANSRRGLASERPWRNFSLLYRHAGRSAAGNGDGLSWFRLRQRDISENRSICAIWRRELPLDRMLDGN